jgi:hypothetical protein
MSALAGGAPSLGRARDFIARHHLGIELVEINSTGFGKDEQTAS